MKYNALDNFNTDPQTIDSVTVINNGLSPIKKIIDFTKVREFNRVWQNDRSYLNGFTLSKIFTETFSLSASMSVIGFRAGAFYSNTRSLMTTTYK